MAVARGFTVRLLLPALPVSGIQERLLFPAPGSLAASGAEIVDILEARERGTDGEAEQRGTPQTNP